MIAKVLIFLFAFNLSVFASIKNEINFVCDEDAMIAYGIYKRGATSRFNAFKAKISSGSMENAYYEVRNGFDFSDLAITSLKDKYANFFAQAKSVEEYIDIKIDYLNYCKDLKEKWAFLFTKTSNEIVDILGVDVVAKNTVYILSPETASGTNRKDIIFWGGHKNFDYSVAEIWHEILRSNFSRDDLSHAIIEHIADNELYKRITGKSYSDKEIFGHFELANIRECLYPHWKTFLDKSNRNIKSFQQDEKVINCSKIKINWSK